MRRLAYVFAFWWQVTQNHAFLSAQIGPSWTIGGQQQWPSLAAEATFGMGCFWKPSEELLKIAGVQETIVGYTGKPDATAPPSYENVCFSNDWVEGVRVRYDESQLSYESLLDACFHAQEPQLGSRQYASIIFPHDVAQQQVAERWLVQNADAIRSDGVTAAMTRIEPRTAFYRAEAYHQRYWQKQRPRFVALFALLVLPAVLPVENNILTNAQIEFLRTGANAISLAICLWTLVERNVNSRVVEI